MKQFLSKKTYKSMRFPKQVKPSAAWSYILEFQTWKDASDEF